MAFQFFILVGIAAWIGQKLDKALETQRPFITILLILLFTAGFFYKLVKDLGRKDES